MTFLEFVAERLMGKPAFRSGGRSSWLCPFHDERHPSFCTLPPKRGYKDRFKCFGCGSWGDEMDLLKLFYPKDDYTQRLERLAELRGEFEAEGGKVTFIIPGGRGVKLLERLLEDQRIDHCDLLDVVSELNHRLNLRREWARLGRKVSVGDSD